MPFKFNPFTHKLDIVDTQGGGGGDLVSLTGNSGGTITGDVLDNINLLTTASTVKFVGTTNTITLNFNGDVNSNLLFGTTATLLTSGFSNVGNGDSTLQFVRDANRNSGYGVSVFSALQNGIFNSGLGFGSGSQYTSTESSNIVINNIGVLGESHVLRIGAGTGTGNQQLTSAFISGISPNTTVNSTTEIVTQDTATDKLGILTYSTGTFTPTFNGSSPGTTTYSIQNGFYTKIGNRVYVDIVVGGSTTGTGDLTFDALPFTVSSQANYYGVGTININSVSYVFPVGLTQIVTFVNSGTTTFNVYGNGSGVTPALMQVPVAGSAIFFISMVYESP